MKKALFALAAASALTIGIAATPCAGARLCRLFRLLRPAAGRLPGRLLGAPSALRSVGQSDGLEPSAVFLPLIDLTFSPENKARL